MPRPYARLRFELRERDIDQNALAAMLKRGDSYISDRMNGKGSWTLWEALEMMRIIGAKPEDFAAYFPPHEVPAPKRGEAS